HFQNSADSLAACAQIVSLRVAIGNADGTTLFENARIQADISETPDELIAGDFECEGTQRLFVARLAQLFRFVVGVDPRDGLDIKGRRQVVHHAVTVELNTLILEGAAAEYGNDLIGDGSGAQSFFELFHRNFFAFKEPFHDGVV